MQKVTDRAKRKWFIRGLDLITYKKICSLIDKGFGKKEIEIILELPDKSVISDAVYLYEKYRHSITAVTQNTSKP